MENLRERLLEKGSKCKLQFSTKEREYYEAECGFTDDELLIFRMRSKGYSVVKISTEMADITGEYWSLSRVESRIRSIKDKILEIL